MTQPSELQSIRQQPQLRPMESAVSEVRHLSLLEVRHGGTRLRLRLYDPDTLTTHTYTFREILGVTFNVAHNLGRIGRTFIVENSTWLKCHVEAPMRTRGIDGAKHFVFCCRDGEVEVLSFGSPEYAASLPKEVKARTRGQPRDDA